MAKCEAASHLNDQKKLTAMKKPALHEKLLLLHEHKPGMPLLLQVKVTLRLTTDALSDVLQQKDVTEAVTAMEQWTQGLFPWTCIDQHESEALDPKRPTFRPIVEAVRAMMDDGQASQEDDDEWMMKMMDRVLAMGCVRAIL